MYIFSLIIEVFSDIITYIISFSILTLSIVIIVNFVCVYIAGAT